MDFLLDCAYCNLTSLDVSSNTTLIELSCGGNQLTSLDVSNNLALTDLYCHHNQLTSLDVSRNHALTNLECSDNKLTSLDVRRNSTLLELYCYDNQLTSLDVSKNTALIKLSCGGNQLTSLDVTRNPALTNLECIENKLTSLNINNNSALVDLSCDDNQLTQLDVSRNLALTNLECSKNKLTLLDVSRNTELECLVCDDNKLTILDVSKNSNLNFLACIHNLITKLDISHCPKLVEMYLEICDEGEECYDYEEGIINYETILFDIGVTLITGIKPSDPTPTPESEGISIHASKPNPIGMKDTVQLTVKAPSGVSLKKLTWKSSNTKIAAVSNKGVVTGKSAGKATITVTTSDKKTASIDIEVQDIHAPTSIKLTSDKGTTIGVKDSVTLKATMTAIGTPQSKLTWKSSNAKVAAVDKKGVVKGKNVGNTTITVTTENKLSASIDITVQDISTSTEVTIQPSTVNPIGIKETLQLGAEMKAIGTPKSKLKWQSSDKKVATVDGKGKVTGKKIGTATITVTTDNQLSDSVTIIVKDVNSPTSISVSPKNADINIKDKMQLTANMTAEGTPKSKL